MPSHRSLGAVRYAAAVGVLLLLAAALANPWTAEFWRGDQALNYLDAYRLSAWTSGIAGALLLALAGWSKRRIERGFDKPLVLLATVAVLLCADRLLLVWFGLPFWVPDPEAHFKNRPNTERLSRAGHAVWHTNAYGYSDDEFPIERPPGELRGLIVGDSITQGFQLGYEQTYPHLLERILDARDSAHPTHQIMNAGVAGYSVFQETIAARDGLRLDPDFIALGFCMNDATEFFQVAKEYGGKGIDYHKVEQTDNPFAGYLLNETGIGRLLQYLRRDPSSLDTRKQHEDYNVRDMVQGMDEPRYQMAWKTVFAQLDAFYALTEKAGVPALLILFPYQFQLASDAWCEPQRILIQHAEEHNASVLDLTPTFFREIYGADTTPAALTASGTDPLEIYRAHQEKASPYYFDSNHLTERGAELAAEAIFAKLQEMGLATESPPTPGSDASDL